MDLKTLLQKTKDKSEKITTTRKPPIIAIDDRPYTIEETSQYNNNNIVNVSVIQDIDQNTPVATLEQVSTHLIDNKKNYPTNEITSNQIKKNDNKITRNIETNQRQGGDKAETKKEINKRQNRDNLEPRASRNKETEDKFEDKTTDKLETNLLMLGGNNLFDTSLLIDPNKHPESFSSLVGLQKNIILFLYAECKQQRSKITRALSIEYIATSCNSTISSIKKSLQRLEKKGVVIRGGFKLGRSGWTQYILSDTVYNEILLSENFRTNTQNWRQTKDNLEPKLETNMKTNSSSSSSNINISTTTDLPADWKKIDLTPLKQINFGMTELKNIYKKCFEIFTPYQIQESINHFAFGITNNPSRYKNMKSPAAVLVNQLNQGILWEEDGYISLEEIAQIEKSEKRRLFLESQFKQPKFFEWFNSLSNEEKDRIVPDGIKTSTSYMVSKEIIQKEQAKVYFEKKIWPKMLEEIMDGISV